jgi:NADPH:quinone reductase-like Zn-dependent oxidoreductase
MHLDGSAGKPLLVERDVPRPTPQRGEVLVRVRAAGITPTELAWYPTTHTKDGGERTAAVPCHEFSGEVAAMGGGVSGLSIGQQIYGLNDWFADGALAEYCVTRPEWIAPKPRRLNHAEAASVPISALTAWQGLRQRAALRPGERVLVHGGAGAVGVFVIQIASLCNARVVTTVSPHNVEFVKELGAGAVIDYKAGAFEDHARGIDVVFDTVGGDTLRRSWAVLGPKGRLVTVAADSEGTADERAKKAFFIVEPDRQQLVEVGKLLDGGELRPVVDTVLHWAQASDAFSGSVKKEGRGKLVVTVAE